MHDLRQAVRPATVRHAAVTGRRATVVSAVAVVGVVLPVLPTWAVATIICWTISLATLTGGGR